MNRSEFIKWIRDNNIEKNVVIKVKRYEDIAFHYGFIDVIDEHNIIFNDINHNNRYRINYSDILKIEKFE
ncbi:MAG: hypothetical protein QXL94_06875 [Candidatus Parvarchaeum sp.]